MKRFIATSLFILFLSNFLFAQSPNGSSKTGTNNTVQNMVSSLKDDTCLMKKFSLVFYAIQDASLSLNNPATLNTFINSEITPRVALLNSVFSKICVSFEHCKTVIIPVHPYREWSDAVEVAVTNSWYMEKVINVYLAESVGNTPCVLDYSYPPDANSENSKKNTVVVCIDPNLGHPKHIIHAMGHFFGLPHTFAEINPNIPVSPPPPTPPQGIITSKEFVNRSNCYLHGDGFCDTEADPFNANNSAPSGRHKFCNYSSAAVDGNGEYYTPPLDNYMSFYSLCYCRFTQEQYNFMAYKIRTQRMYLH